MSIEFKIQSVQIIDPQELQEYLPALAMMIKSSMPNQKSKRRKRKAKKTIGPMIQDIIDSIE